MLTKIRLVFGQKFDAPFANSALACLLLTVILAVGSGVLWSEAGDTLGLTRETAKVTEITVASAEVTGEGGYTPRLEIVTQDGETVSLLKSAAGESYAALCESVQAGDTLTLRLSRKGSVMEVEKDGMVLLDFDSAKSAGTFGRILNVAAAILFDLLAILLAVRTIVLAMNRRTSGIMH